MSNLSNQRILRTDMVPDVTPDDITLLRRIKKSVSEGHDIEIKKTPNGKLKVLEVSKKNIAVG